MIKIITLADYKDAITRMTNINNALLPLRQLVNTESMILEIKKLEQESINLYNLTTEFEQENGGRFQY